MQKQVWSLRSCLWKSSKSAAGLSLIQAQNSLDQAKESKQKAQDNIEKSYEDAYNAISNAFLDMPTIMTDLDDVLFSNDLGKSESSIGQSQSNSSALMNSTAPAYKDRLEIFQIPQREIIMRLDQNMIQILITIKIQRDIRVRILLDIVGRNNRDN